MEHAEWCKEQFKFRKLELGLEVNQKVSNPVDLEDTKPTAMWRWGWQEDQQYLLGDQRREVHDYRKFGLEVQYTKDNASIELILKDTILDSCSWLQFVDGGTGALRTLSIKRRLGGLLDNPGIGEIGIICWQSHLRIMLAAVSMGPASSTFQLVVKHTT